MHNRKSKLLFVANVTLITALLSTSICMVPNTVNAEERTQISLAETSQQSVEQNNKLINYFQKIKPKSKMVETDNTDLYYPDYYGGSYLNDSQELVVLVTNNNNTTTIKNEIKTVTENESLKFDYVDFSYSELNNIIKHIIDTQDIHSTDNNYSNSIYSDIIDCTLDDVNNQVIVGIKNLDAAKINEFKEKVINSSCIVFESKNYSPTYGDTTNDVTNETDSSEYNIKSTRATTTLKPGNGIYAGNGGTYSIGFPAVRYIDSGPQYGFVTAGHYMETGLNILNVTNAAKCGTVKLVSFGGKYDVSFVALNTGFSCSNVISETWRELYDSNEEICYPVVGKNIYVYGYYTKNKTGKITSTNYSFRDNVGGKSFNNMVKTTKLGCINGDSGGLIASVADDNYHMIQEGIYCGNVLDNDENTIANYYCTAGNIVTLWHLSCY